MFPVLNIQNKIKYLIEHIVYLRIFVFSYDEITIKVKLIQLHRLKSVLFKNKMNLS